MLTWVWHGDILLLLVCKLIFIRYVEMWNYDVDMWDTCNYVNRQQNVVDMKENCIQRGIRENITMNGS